MEIRFAELFSGVENIIQKCEKSFREDLRKTEIEFDKKVCDLDSKLTSTMDTRFSEVDTRIDATQRVSEETIKNVESLKENVTERLESNEAIVRDEMRAHKQEVLATTTTTEREVTDIRGKVDRDFQDLSTRMDSLPPRSCGAGGGGVVVPSHFRFTGEGKDHPCAFLKTVEDYFLLYEYSEVTKARLMTQLLPGGAKVWFDTLGKNPETFVEFKVKILERYWNDNEQMNFKISLLNGAYRTAFGRMRNYAARKVAALRQCTPKLNDVEIINILTRHFPFTTQNLLKSAGDMSLERFQNLLGEFDAAYAANSQARGPREASPNVSAMTLRRPGGAWSRRVDRPTGNGGGRNGHWVRRSADPPQPAQPPGGVGVGETARATGELRCNS